MYHVIYSMGENQRGIPKMNEEKVTQTPQNDDILVVKNLKTYFPLGKDFFKKVTLFVKAVDGVSFTIKRGKTLGVVGESWLETNNLGRAILRLTP
jgi:ABC-type oligopeptide transport system ATPase subunit